MFLAFIHTPKTGGTSVTRLLGERYNLLHLNGAADFSGFLNMPSESRKSYDVAVGHMPFGIERYVGPITLATFLRDPIDRVVSGYYYARRSVSHPNHAAIQSMSLREYVESNITFMNDNGMTRRMADYDWSEVHSPPFWWQRVPIGAVSGKMLDQAKANLRQCSFVGLYEDFNADVSRMFAALDIESPQEIPKENVSWDRPALEDIDQETMAALRRFNEYDLDLYEFAKGLRQ